MEICEPSLTACPDSRREEPQWSDRFPGLLRDATGTGQSKAGRYGEEQYGSVNPTMADERAGNADTDSTGLERCTFTGKLEETGKDTAEEQPAGFLRPDWKEFPTQSPVCGRDDGVSRQLDGITFSQ